MNRDQNTAASARPIPSGIRVGDAMIRNPKLLGPSTTIAQVHEFFGDDHVHAALLVDRGRLLAVIEPPDLIDSPPGTYLAMAVGRLRGRITKPDADLAATWETMTALSCRRLAVVDDRGEFVGLLCLKSSGLGFCSDADVRARAEDLVSRL
jgi:CBS domain-containing protein